MSNSDTDLVVDPFKEWRRGVTFTTRAEARLPLQGRTHVFNVTSRRLQAAAFGGFHDLYARAFGIANARVNELEAEYNADPCRSWIRAQGWGKVPEFEMEFASVIIGVTVDNSHTERVHGESPASASALEAPHLGAFATLSARDLADLDEMYIDFDFSRADETGVSGWMLSYGEYASDASLDIAPFVKRAESRGAFCSSALTLVGARYASANRISYRDVNILTNIGKSNRPDNMIDVVLHFEE